MSSIRIILFAVVLFLSVAPVRAAEPDGAAQGNAPAAGAVVAKCEHGVKQSICTRCNPKLEPVFKAKNDWCAEHSRPESQCVICHPELAEQGVK
jgi:hypothetical protein